MWNLEYRNIKYIRFSLLIVIGIILWYIPAPNGLNSEAWHMFTIFILTILGILLKVMPIAQLSIISLTVILATKVNDPTSASKALKYSMSGFSQGVIWLIVVAFFIAKSFAKTGLGMRIAYLFIKFLGKKTISLTYGLVLTDLVLAPAMPSNTARNGGITYPIVRSLSLSYDSSPENGTQKKIGSYLVLTLFHCGAITSAMFLTAMAANPLCVKIAADFGITITWTQWFIAALVPGIISLVLIPLILFKFYSPEIKRTDNASKFASEKLSEMGKLKIDEIILLIVFVLLLTLWISGSTINMNTTTAAFIGLSILLITGVLSLKDVLSETSAWNTFIWFSVLVMMADNMSRLGFMSWLSQIIKSSMGNISWLAAFFILVLLYLYIHYIFASQTAHIAALYPVFLGLGIALKVPPILMALSLAFAGNIMSGLTHYANGPAPIFFGSGYVELGTWWKFGFILSIFNIIVWFGIGWFWWKIIGLV